MENIAKHVFERKNGQGLCLARCANNETSAKRSCNRSNCPMPLILRCVSTIFTETNRSLSPIFSKKKKKKKKSKRRKHFSKFKARDKRDHGWKP